MKRKLLLVITAILFCSALSAQTYHFPEPNAGVFDSQNSMDFYKCTVSVDGVVQTSPSIEVAAYSDGIISGREFLRASDGVLMMAIMANAEGDPITFKIYNHDTGEGDDYTCNTTYSFVEDATIMYEDIAFVSNTTPEEEEIPYPWTVPSTGEEDYTGMCCQIQLNGVIVTENNRWDLGVFIGTTCIAHNSELTTPPPALSPTPVSNLEIYGHKNEEASFLLYDITNSRYFQGTCDYTQTLDWDVHGNVRNPIVLNFIAPYVFEGTEDTSWDTENNWKEPSVGLPSETDEVTINGLCELDQDVTVKNIIVNNGKTLKVMPGKTLTLTEGFTTTDASQLVLVDDAQLIDAAQTAGKASYMKTVKGYNSNDNNWYILGSPVGTTAIAETDFPTDEYDLYWYDETNQTHEEWKNFKQAQSYSFFPGRGYLYAHDTDYAPSIPGTLSYDNVTFDMTYTDRTYDDLDGLNLLGNPYPFAITIDNFQNDKLTDGFYLLENGAWDPKPSSTPIPTGQGFLIGCTESNTVTFQANTAKSRGTHNSSIEVRIANNTNTDHAYIVLGEGNDLIKIHHRNDEIPEVFIPKSNKPYAIAHFDRNIESVNLAYHPTIAGQQTLTVKLEGSYEFMTLIDNLTGTKVDMLANNAYTFTAKENDNVNRFTLRFKSNTNVNENTTVNPISYLSNGQLNINGIEGESELQFIDMLGRVVNTTTIHGNYSQKINMTAGVYVVRVINGSNTYTQKIVVE